MNSLEYVKEVAGKDIVSFIRNLVFHQGKTPHQVGHSVYAVLKSRGWEAPPAFIRAVEDVAQQAVIEDRAWSNDALDQFGKKGD